MAVYVDSMLGSRIMMQICSRSEGGAIGCDQVQGCKAVNTTRLEDLRLRRRGQAAHLARDFSIPFLRINSPALLILFVICFTRFVFNYTV
jgi:hypothetical protein